MTGGLVVQILVSPFLLPLLEKYYFIKNVRRQERKKEDISPKRCPESLLFIVLHMLLCTRGEIDIDFTESHKPPVGSFSWIPGQ